MFGEEPRVGLGTSRESSAQCRTALGFIYFGGRQRGGVISGVTYLFPILALAAMAFWYVRMHQKGAALGGGIAEAFAKAQKEKRGNLLAPGEDVKVWGSGVLWRPSRQYWLAKQFPFLKLVWPMKVYSTIVTDRGRLLLAT